ncbi:MAG: hypothetical protein H6718_09380 [Polyangiaceae bacterium]|nr:hypothetical protein [Polyangiaceae bacterium]MCB9606387.1 hypothetical protein [Polyangiaceae bacterium]
MAPSANSSSRTTLWIVLGVGGLFVFGLVSLLVLGGYLYVKDQRLLEEAEKDTARLAKRVAACGAPLPESTEAVPKDVPSKPFDSAPGDWAAPAFTCEGGTFTPSRPQLYRFRWLKESDQKGRVIGEGDANFDGKVDTTIESEVDCTSGSCEVITPHVKSHF